MQNDGGMHRKLEKKPWIIMHAGCTRKSPPLATIPTHRVHQKTPTINIDLAPVKPAGKQRKNLKKEYRYKKHRQNSKSESKHTLAWKIYRSWVIGRQNTLERSNSGHLSFQVKIDEVTEKFQWEVDEKPRQDELGRGPRTVLMRENTGEEVVSLSLLLIMGSKLLLKQFRLLTFDPEAEKRITRSLEQCTFWAAGKLSEETLKFLLL